MAKEEETAVNSLYTGAVLVLLNGCTTYTSGALGILEMYLLYWRCTASTGGVLVIPMMYLLYWRCTASFGGVLVILEMYQLYEAALVILKVY